MNAFQENRRKVILKNGIIFLVLSVILLPIINNYFSIHKSKIELIILFLSSFIGLILSTKKVKLQFDDKRKILTIINSHILGGGTKYSIPYENLQFYLTPKNILNRILNRPELTILDNDSKITEINNLRNIYKANELITLLESVTKKIKLRTTVVLQNAGLSSKLNFYSI